jgi:putative hydrolase of HD superfamily
MDGNQIEGALDFLRQAERLKDVIRSSHTSEGRPESTAEHTWRLCLMAIVFADGFGGIDLAKLLKICVVHDLGEALGGDVPAVVQTPDMGKAQRERRDLATLTAPLPAGRRDEILALWDEYEAAASPEALVAKGLDKLETILQHNQGRNAADFDYAFNLDYGVRHTSTHPLLAAIRALLDEGTRARLAEREQAVRQP